MSGCRYPKYAGSRKTMIIDFHSHNFPRIVAARAIAQMSRATEGVLWPVGDGTLENQLDNMELAGVDRAVMCPIATKPPQFNVILRTAEQILSGELGERAQRRIIPFASVHPQDPELIPHLRAIAAAGIRGIKFHPYYQNFSLADPSVWPMFRTIADLGLVVECHAGHDLGYADRTDACGPSEIATLLRNVPGLTFVAAHLGGCAGYPAHATDDLLELGCYIDTSALHRDWHRDEQIRLLRGWPTERILFATDFPWVNYAEAVSWVKSIRVSGDWESLFAKNALRLLKLD